MKSTSIDKKHFLGIYEKAINNKFDWEDKILIAKSAGFDFIEISIDESDFRLERLSWSQDQIKKLKDLLVFYNFRINSMCLSAHRRFPFGSADPKIRNKAREIMLSALKLAQQLGIRIIQLAGYDVYYEKSTKQTKNYFLENISWAAKLAQKYSIILAFEIMDTPFMGTITKALKYVQKINSPFLQIYPDLGNIYQWSDDLETEFAKGKNHYVGMHFKDTKNKVFKCIPFGKGQVDFVYLLKILNALDYQGPFLIEMWSENNKNESIEDNIKELIKAKKFYLKQQKQAWNE